MFLFGLNSPSPASGFQPEAMGGAQIAGYAMELAGL